MIYRGTEILRHGSGGSSVPNGVTNHNLSKVVGHLIAMGAAFRIDEPFRVGHDFGAA